MARTRSEISALVILNTGRSDKTTLINSLCDTALKIAVTKHAFQDSLHICDDVAITEDAISVSISSLTEGGVSIGDVIDIITSRIAGATVVAFTAGEHAVVAGESVIGGTSGATGYVIHVESLASGTWAGTDAVGNIWICNKSGTFTAAEDLEDADGNTVAVITADPGAGGTLNSDLVLKNKQWWDANIINPEDNLKGWPVYGLKFGSNIILDGPANDEIALRLRVSAIPEFALLVAFTSGGTHEVIVGDTITGSTSGATAKVMSITLSSGTYAGGDAAGTLYLRDVTGTFQAAEEIQDADANNLATITAAPSADNAECPISILDLFIEQYATAMVYLSLGMTEKYISWYIMALGREYDRGKIGGTLLAAILKDGSDTAEHTSLERGGGRNVGLAIENNITSSDNYGNTSMWY